MLLGTFNSCKGPNIKITIKPSGHSVPPNQKGKYGDGIKLIYKIPFSSHFLLSRHLIQQFLDKMFDVSGVQMLTQTLL